MNIIYKEALASDAEGLLKHLQSVGSETDNLSYGKDTFSISPEREAKFINRFYNSEKDLMLVALDGDTVVGNAIVERNKILRYNHRAEISITVLKDYWGQGIGSELMRRMISFAENTGARILYLEVRADNTRAISLYEKFGFKSIGIYPDFFKINGNYYDASLMMLKL